MQVHCISVFLLISHAARYLCTYMRVCLCVSVCLCVCARVLVCSRLRAGVCIPDRMKAMSTLKSAPVPNLTASIDFWLCGRPSARMGDRYMILHFLNGNMSSIFGHSGVS